MMFVVCLRLQTMWLTFEKGKNRPRSHSVVFLVVSWQNAWLPRIDAFFSSNGWRPTTCKSSKEMETNSSWLRSCFDWFGRCFGSDYLPKSKSECSRRWWWKCDSWRWTLLRLLALFLKRTEKPETEEALNSHWNGTLKTLCVSIAVVTSSPTTPGSFFWVFLA